MRNQWLVMFVLCSGLLMFMSMSNAHAQDGDETVQTVAITTAVGETTRTSVRSDGGQANADNQNPYVSADGRYIAFASDANNLVSDDTNGTTDIFVYDRDTNQTNRVSLTGSGGQANFASFAPAISDNGRYVAFCSYATNLIDNDNNNVVDVFLRDREAGSTILVSRSIFGLTGNNGSCQPDLNPQDVRGPDISADGRYVVFESFASDLIGNDNNSTSDIFRFDRDTGLVERISVDTNGAEANGASFYPSVSADGQRIAFASLASNLVTGDSNGYADIFVRNIGTGNTRRVSVDSDGGEGNGASQEPEISDDGLFVVFSSFANNLVSNDNNSYMDVFIRDRAADKTYLASVSSSGVQSNAFADSMEPSVSADGRFVTFQSYASSLVPGESNTDTRDVFVRDRQNLTTAYASVSSSGQIGNQSSREPVISADGFYIVFSSKADNLVAGDTNGNRDIFSHQIQAEEPPPPPPVPTLSVSFTNGAPGSIFAFTGTNYGQNQPVAIYVNNVNVGIITSDLGENIAFRLNTNAGTQAGVYAVRAENSAGRASVVLSIDPTAPTRPASGSGSIFDIPDNIAYTQQAYLSVVFHK